MSESTLTAAQAREMTAAALKGPVIDGHLEALDKAIIDATKKGRSSIDPDVVLSQIRSNINLHDAATRQAVRLHYESKGFRWTDHPDPDPGHPGSRPYTTLGW